MGKICKQPQPVNESVQDLVRIPKDLRWQINPVQVWLWCLKTFKEPHQEEGPQQILQI